MGERFLGVFFQNFLNKFFANKNKKDFENFFNYSSAGALILIVNWVKSDFKENVHTLADTLEGLLSASLAYLN